MITWQIERWQLFGKRRCSTFWLRFESIQTDQVRNELQLNVVALADMSHLRQRILRQESVVTANDHAVDRDAMDLEFLQSTLEVCGVGNNRYTYDPSTKQRTFVIDNRYDAVALRRVRTDEFDVQGGEVIGANHNNVFGWRILDMNRMAILFLAQNGCCPRGN